METGFTCSKLRAGILAIGLLGCAVSASAQDNGETQPPAPLPEDLYMTDEELLADFTDRELEGCYTGVDIWAERTAADGSLYDLLKRGALVGEWWVANGEICYRYTDRAVDGVNTFCWRVARQNGDYYFFSAEDQELGGTTDCPELTS